MKIQLLKPNFQTQNQKRKVKKANKKEQQQRLQDKTAPITAVLYMSEKEVVVIITQETAKNMLTDHIVQVVINYFF